MFLRIVSDSFTRKPRRKVLTAAALALGMAVATATLEVALDVGDRLAREFRSLGANLLVTPASDTLPLEIGGVDYRPVDAGAYLPAGDLGKLKTIFWRNNVMGFAPFLDVPVAIASARFAGKFARGTDRHMVQPLRSRFPTAARSRREFRPPIPGGTSMADGFRMAAEEARGGRGARAAFESACRKQSQNRCGRPLAHADDHGHCFHRGPRGQFHPRASGNRAGSGGPPRPVSAPAGERADETGGRFLRARSRDDDSGGIRPLVLQPVHFLDLAPDSAATSRR